MAWTSPRTWVANVTAITALALNTDLRDNLNYLKGLLDGTGSDVVTVPNDLRIENDSVFNLSKSGSNPLIVVDSNDWIDYIRASNAFRWIVNSAVLMQLASDGKLTGAGFYDSGNLTLSAGTSSTVNHGLGARPRFLWGWMNTTSTAALADSSTTSNSPIRDDFSSATVVWDWATNTQIRISNGLGVTAYARIFAIL